MGLAHFFYGPNRPQAKATNLPQPSDRRMSDLQQDIQTRLSELDPDVDLLAVEQPGNEMLRLFIDHPDGVDLALCERVTRHLNDLRADYALEVSSPGDKYRQKRASIASETKESPQ